MKNLRKSCRYVVQLTVIGLAWFFVPLGHSLSITGVSADNAVFNPEKQESARIHYHIDQPASVTLSIFDARDWLVKTYSTTHKSAGDYGFTWDGTDNSGQSVPPEAYRYTLTAHPGAQQTKAVEPVVYDLTEQTGGMLLAVKNLQWEPDQGHIRYHLPQAARVAIRIGLADHGPLLKTVVNWRPQAAGEQREAWDGMDSSNIINLSQHPKLELVVDAFTLPRNHLLVVSETRQPGFIQQLGENGSRRQQQQRSMRPSHLLYRQPADKRGDFPLQLSLLGTYPLNDQGVPEVSGEVAFRLDVDSDDLQRIASQRFEPVFYLDGRYVYENEVGYFPMTYRWDSRNYNNGSHFITANLRGYASNFGMATLKIQVRNPQ